jgi:hypothetical protein
MLRQMAGTTRTGGGRNLGLAMSWSSIFRKEMPMGPGRNPSTHSRMIVSVSPSNIKFSKTTLWTALRQAAATQANPRDSGRMPARSVFAGTRRTLLMLFEGALPLSAHIRPTRAAPHRSRQVLGWRLYATLPSSSI